MVIVLQVIPSLQGMGIGRMIVRRIVRFAVDFFI